MLTALRRWMAGSPARGSHRSRVELPAVVDVPPSVLRMLRELHPSLDAYIRPTGELYVLQRQPGREHVAIGRQMLLQRAEPGPRYHARLMADGWRLLAILPHRAVLEPTRIERTIAPMLTVGERDLDRAFDEALAHADGTRAMEAKLQLVLDRVKAEQRFDQSVIRGRVSSILPSSASLPWAQRHIA